jgi:hypothetical protein
MIVFELSMPNKGSWNGKWSQEGQCFARVIDQRKVPKEVVAWMPLPHAFNPKEDK